MNRPARSVALVLLALVLSASSMASAATCTWTGASSTDWATSGNWSCAAVPGASDVVVFDGSSTPTATVAGVTAGTLVSLQVVNNAQVTLQASAASTVSLANPGGNGLVIQSGAKLTLGAGSAITISHAAGTSGSVSGAMSMTGSASTAHRLLAASSLAPITFLNGAVFTSDANQSGAAFGTTTFNSVVFASGSTYVHKSGATNPFGATQPDSVVVFQTGSLYSQQSSGGLSFSGRTYADFEFNYAGSVSTSGSNPVSIDNLTVKVGTLNIGMTGSLSAIKGSISVASGTTLNFNPSSAATMNLNGTAVQTISGTGTLTFGANQAVVVNNPSGVSLQRSVTVSGPLTLTAGDVTTGAFVLTLGGTVSGGTGEIVGNARRTTFVAGTNYAFNNPRTLVNFTSLTTAPTDLTFTLTKTTPSGLPLALPRTYTITPTGAPVFTGTLQLGYRQSEVDGVAGLNEATLAAIRFGGSVWAAQPGSVDTANDFVTATGVTAFSDWGIAPPPVPTLTINDVSASEGDSGTKTFTFTVTVFPLATGAVTFDIATANGTATATVPAAAGDDYVAKSLTGQTIPFGSGTYTFDVTVNGDTTLEPTETFLVNVTNVAGGGVLVGDSQGQGTIVNDEPTLIHDIQGSGTTSPMVGQAVKIRGIVVADYQGSSPNLGGFYVEEESSDFDGNTATSEGIFVYSNTAVSVGDKVEVDGTVTEYLTSSGGLTSSLTELASVASVVVLSSGNALPTPVAVTFPVTALADLERFEGMLVTFPQTMTVVENYDLARYGSVTLSGTGRLWTPTHAASPGAAAAAVADLNDRSMIVLDDASTSSYPATIPYPAGGLTAANTLRDGATVSGLQAVLEDRYGVYRLQPTGPVTFTPSNPRPPAPAAPGTRVRAVSMNTLNYFNGDGLGGGFPTSRGADSLAEFNRQRAKTIAAMLSLDADVYGLMEIENDAPGSSAIEDLVAGLNAATSAGTFAFVNTGVMGTDAIRSAIVYKPARLTPVGTYAVLNQSVDPRFEDYGNRPTIAQTFQKAGTNAKFTFVVNHLRSKGSCGSATGGNVDSGDGQGCWNLSRTNAASAIRDWIATDPTGSGDPDFLVVGDMNSYRLEDPITAFTTGAGALANLTDSFLGPEAYSYIYMAEAGYLDHALATSHLASQVSGVLHWHNNADEPIALDYNVESKTVAQQASLYAPDGYRAADHDPVVVDLDLNLPPTVDAGGPYTTTAGFSTALTATAGDPNGSSVAVEWDLDNNGSYETPGTSVTFPATFTTGAYTVGVRATEIGADGLFATDVATVNVVLGPAITSPAIATFTIGGSGTFAITTTGFPAPTLTLIGTLPAGLAFVDNGNGTGTISGTPGAGTAGTYEVTIRASNGVGQPFDQVVTVVVAAQGTANVPALGGPGLAALALLVALGGALVLGRRLS